VRHSLGDRNADADTRALRKIVNAKRCTIPLTPRIVSALPYDQFAPRNSADPAPNMRCAGLCQLHGYRFSGSTEISVKRPKREAQAVETADVGRPSDLLRRSENKAKSL
jgi:hypothetical protein